jgi:hypothetical protein
MGRGDDIVSDYAYLLALTDFFQQYPAVLLVQIPSQL